MIRGLELKINIPPLQESKVGGGGCLYLKGGVIPGVGTVCVIGLMGLVKLCMYDLAGLSPSSSYLTPSSAAAELLSSGFIPSPTPSVTSYNPTNTPSSSYLTPSSAAAELLSSSFIPSPTSSVTSYSSTDTLSNGGNC